MLQEHRFLFARGPLTTFLLLLSLLLFANTASATIVSGVVRDASDSAAIGFATATVSPTGFSMSANQNGEYRLLLPPGRYTIRFTHVAHYSETVELDVGDLAITKDVYLQPAVIEVSPISVWDRQYDAAQRIIIEAIKRKDEILSQIQQYQFDAYSKIIATDTGKADSINCFAILESQVRAYWKYPGNQKEIITARRQTANIPAEFNLLSPGQLLNFNKNRIDLGQFAVVSPTATDALDYYNYYLIDTTYIDGKAVFVLEIEPKDENNPLFVGEIKIVDSSYAVVGVDVAFTEGFDDSYSSDEHYRQVYSQFNGRYWMPTLVQFSAILDLKALTLFYPIIAIDYVVAIHSYDFSGNIADTVFGEYAIEVDRGADDIDSATWDMGQMMPLTDLERRGYEYRDSLANSKQLYEKILTATLMTPLYMAYYPDYFHFNRVEGSYLGIGHRFYGIADRWDLRVKTGYAFDAKLWQHEYGARYLLYPRQRLSLAALYRDEVRTRPTIFAPRDGSAAFSSLITRYDAYDYYREKGFELQMQTKLLNQTRLNLQYNDFRHLSLANHTDFGGLFGGDSTYRPNPAIVDGKLRSIEVSLSYDSRKLARSKGRDIRLFEFPYADFEIGAEYASNDLIPTDFNFTRYYAELRSAYRLFDFIVGRVFVYAGASDKSLPPQKYFTIDHDPDILPQSNYFHTLAGENYSGSRVLSIYTNYDFGGKFFQKTGIPLLNRLPFEITIHGGVFWTDLKGNPYQAGDENIRLAPTPYSEIGFSVGRIIPYGFFSQWGLSLTRQLSNYDTKKTHWGIINSYFSF